MTVHRATSNAKKGEPGHTVGTREVPAMSSGTPGTARGGDELSAQFLLAEFDALQERAIQYEQANASRVNFFLLVVAALSAGLAAALDVQEVRALFMQVVLVVSLFLLVVGLATLHNVANYSMATISFHRRAGRVRRWFLEQAPSIENYLAFEPADDRPKLYVTDLEFRGGEAIILALDSALAALAGGFAALLCGVSGLAVVLIAIIAGVVALILQRAYLLWKLRRTESRSWVQEQVHFPSEPLSPVNDPRQLEK